MMKPIDVNVVIHIEDDFNIKITGNEVTFFEGMIIRPRHAKLVTQISEQIRNMIDITIKYAKDNGVNN